MSRQFKRVLYDDEKIEYALFITLRIIIILSFGIIKYSDTSKFENGELELENEDDVFILSPSSMQTSLIFIYVFKTT